jgi:6,7-dimethyl-8-ribityllumazine synthase
MAQPSAPGELPRDAGRGLRIGIVVSRFNEALCKRLLESCRDALDELGVRSEDVVLAEVPGALEIPPALQWLAQSGRCDALVALGAVIRGETYHFEVVSNESARGVMDVQLETGLPVANGILTTENEAQALARVDKGGEAARVAVEMARLRAALAERN